MTDKEASAQRVEDACQKIEDILHALDPGEAKEAIVGFCAGYLLKLADDECANDRRKNRIREGAYALEAFKGKVHDRISEIITEELKEKAVKAAKQPVLQ